MVDLGERVAQLLGSEEGMEQVRQLMASLSGGDGGPDLSSLLGMLGGAGGENGNCSPSGQQQNSFGDPGMMLELTRALSAVRRPDPNVALLEALRPFFEEPRRKKVDNAIRMMKLMELLPVLQQSGLLSGLLGGEENG